MTANSHEFRDLNAAKLQDQLLAAHAELARRKVQAFEAEQTAGVAIDRLVAAQADVERVDAELQRYFRRDENGAKAQPPVAGPEMGATAEFALLATHAPNGSETRTTGDDSGLGEASKNEPREAMLDPIGPEALGMGPSRDDAAYSDLVGSAANSSAELRARMADEGRAQNGILSPSESRALMADEDLF